MVLYDVVQEFLGMFLEHFSFGGHKICERPGRQGSWRFHWRSAVIWICYESTRPQVHLFLSLFDIIIRNNMVYIHAKMVSLNEADTDRKC